VHDEKNILRRRIIAALVPGSQFTMDDFFALAKANDIATSHDALTALALATEETVKHLESESLILRRGDIWRAVTQGADD